MDRNKKICTTTISINLQVTIEGVRTNIVNVVDVDQIHWDKTDFKGLVEKKQPLIASMYKQFGRKMVGYVKSNKSKDFDDILALLRNKVDKQIGLLDE
jgi:hypothetical protein